MLGVFWTIFMIFLWVIWFWILITILIDLFRSHDLSGWAKALWFIFILLLPLIGVVVYLIARGGKMHEHAVWDAQLQEKQFRTYVQEAAGSLDRWITEDQLAKFADLRNRGVITAKEYDRLKDKFRIDLLASTERFPHPPGRDVALELIRLARSDKPENTDRLLMVAMTRGLRYPRIAVEAVAAEKTAKMSRYLLWATALASLAGILSVVAAFLTWLVPHH